MGIGVEETEADQLLQIAGGPFLRHRRRVDAGADEGLPVVDLDARQVVETEHPAGAEFPDHRRDADARVVEELLPEAGGMLRLEAEIQLPHQYAAALLGDAHPVASGPPAGMALHHRRHLLEHLQVEAEETLQSGPLHLEDDLAAAAQAGPVHLSEAGGAEGIDRQIDDLGPPLPQLPLEQGFHHCEGKGGHPVLEMGQFLHHLDGQHVGPGREQLAQLDERRAELEELGREPAGAAPLPGSLAIGCAPPRVGPGPAIPPEPCQELHHQSPDAQGTPEAGQQVPGGLGLSHQL